MNPPTGTDLYRQGDICSTYFIVLSGWIALSVLFDDGSCQILDFARRGELPLWVNRVVSTMSVTCPLRLRQRPNGYITANRRDRPENEPALAG